MTVHGSETPVGSSLEPSRYDLSLVIPVGPHDEANLEALLASIDRQAFPKDRLELLLCYDGHSEAARARGIQQAQGEIIGCLDTDNQLLGFEFLSVMVGAARQPGVCGAYPSHYAWFASDPPLNRYFALLGANDPLAWWLGKADRRSWLVAAGAGPVVHRGSLPTLGSNGFFVKRSCAQPFWQAWQTSHIDGCQAMAEAGHRTYTIVDSVIWHKTATTLRHWLGKRYRYAQRLALGSPRKWRMVGTARDWLSTSLFALASLCVLPHLWLSCIGYRRVRDWSWAYHPLAALCLTLVYGVALCESIATRMGLRKPRW